MGDNKELVSVIVPVFNREHVLKECVESILNQTYKQLQVILIDDGSTDNSFFLCNDLANKDNRVFVIHQKNNGPAFARNTGMNVAKGKYVMFVDSDDFLHPNCIEILFKAIKRFNANIAMCEHGIQNHTFGLYPKYKFSLIDSNTLLNIGLSGKEELLYCWAKLWRCEVVRDIRFKSLSFCEDNLFTIEALLNYQSSIVKVLGDPLYFYLRRNDSITKNFSDKNLLDSLQAAKLVLEETTMQSSFDIQKSAMNYCINTAFFAYLHAHDVVNESLIKSQSLRMIQKYRKFVLLNNSSLLKAKVACLISYFSMNAVQMVYGLVSKQ